MTMWPTLPLQSLMSKPIQYGVVQRGDGVQDGVPCIRVADMGDHGIREGRIVRVSARIHGQYRKTELQGGEVLFALRGEIGRVAVVPSSLAGANIHRGVARLAVNPERADPGFLAVALTSSQVRRRIRLQVNGSALQELPIAHLRRIEIPLPPLTEQRRINSIVSAWQRAAYMLDRLVAEKVRLRQGLAQHLLSGRLSLTGVPRQAWHVMRLSDLMVESRELGATGDQARKLTVRLYGRGVVRKIDLRPGSARTQYYRRHAGQFIYSKLDFLNGAFGLIPAELDGFESTLDLPAFDLAATVDARWVLRLFSWPEFYRSHFHLANGGRKARRVGPSQLLAQRIEAPPIAEQSAAAEFLDSLDREIELLKLERSQNDLQRRAVVDALVSGELRVALHQAREAVAT